jgi:hypothetical protein
LLPSAHIHLPEPQQQPTTPQLARLARFHVPDCILRARVRQPTAAEVDPNPSQAAQLHLRRHGLRCRGVPGHALGSAVERAEE